MVIYGIAVICNILLFYSARKIFEIQTDTHMITVNESVTKIFQMNYQHNYGVLHIPVLHIELYDQYKKQYMKRFLNISLII
jgi:hypothetical protein